jgi:hypothetical protein
MARTHTTEHAITAEQLRLDEGREKGVPWRQWGPYLSERQWGTVREDYSQDGNAWDYFSHDQARSRAYHWGEDGLAGISDDQQRLCFALALWNGKDPILKERVFGLTNSEANHGEDVKEYYYYLDSTPTHSYMKYLYKYPQNEKTATAAISTKAAFSGSTISAYSTAARHCRPAVIWSRPTARPGWPSTRRTCSKSLSSWRRTTEPMKSWQPMSACNSC